MSDTDARIERLPLLDAILSRLRDMIIEGQLPPGTRLNEGQIGQQLGVSRTPLREAIKYLASEGLVELVPARGAVVKQFGAREVRDMLEVIRILEQQAGSSPARRRRMRASRGCGRCMTGCSTAMPGATAWPITS